MNMFNAKNLRKLIIVGSFVFMCLVVAMPAFAQQLDVGLDPVGQSSGLGNQDIRSTIGSIINVALGFLGVVAIVIVLIGGFKYMVAGGNEENVGKAKKWIISGIIGLAIVLSAYAITSFVLAKLLESTGASDYTGATLIE